MAGFLTLRWIISVCLCLSGVFVSVTKISKKILNRPTSYLVEAFPLTQGGNHSILKKNHPREKGCVRVCVVCVWGGRSKFGPND